MSVIMPHASVFSFFNRIISAEIANIVRNSSNRHYIFLITFQNLLRKDRFHAEKIRELEERLVAFNLASDAPITTKLPALLTALTQDDYFNTAIEKRMVETELYLRGKEAVPSKAPTRRFQWKVKNGDVDLVFEATGLGDWFLLDKDSKKPNKDDVLEKIINKIMSNRGDEKYSLNLNVYRAMLADPDQLFTKDEKQRLSSFQKKGKGVITEKTNAKVGRLVVDSFNREEQRFYVELVSKWLGIDFDTKRDAVTIADLFHLTEMASSFSDNIVKTEASLSSNPSTTLYVASSSSGGSPARSESSTPAPAHTFSSSSNSNSTAAPAHLESPDPSDLVLASISSVGESSAAGSASATRKRSADAPAPAIETTPPFFPQNIMGINDLSKIGGYGLISIDIKTYTQIVRAFLQPKEEEDASFNERSLKATTELLKLIRDYERLLKIIINSPQGFDGRELQSQIFLCISNILVGALSLIKLTAPFEMEPQVNENYQNARGKIIYFALVMHNFMLEADILSFIKTTSNMPYVKRQRVEILASNTLEPIHVKDFLYKLQMFKKQIEILAGKLMNSNNLLPAIFPSERVKLHYKKIIEALDFLNMKLDVLGDDIKPNISLYPFLQEVVVVSAYILNLSHSYFEFIKEDLVTIRAGIIQGLMPLLEMCYKTQITQFINQLTAPAPVLEAGPANNPS